MTKNPLASIIRELKIPIPETVEDVKAGKIKALQATLGSAQDLQKYISLQTEQIDFAPSLLKNLLAGKFWHVLGLMDGYPNENGVSPQNLFVKRNKQREQIKQLPSFYFNNLVKTSVLQAMYGPLLPSETFKQGHANICDYLFEENSMFENALGDEFRSYANTMRFWESVGKMLIYINYGYELFSVEKSLGDATPPLNPKYNKIGFSLFNASLKKPHTASLNIGYFHCLSEPALKTLLSFAIDNESSLSSNFLEQIADGYVNAVLSWDYDRCEPKFFSDNNEFEGNLANILKYAPFQKTVCENEHLQETIASKLQEGFLATNEKPIYFKNFAETVLQFLPRAVVIKNKIGSKYFE